MDSESILSDLDNTLDSFPDTPVAKCVDNDPDQTVMQMDTPQTATKINSNRHRIRPEKMLSRMGSFVNITNPVSLEELYEYEWEDSDSESPCEKHKESYMVQELLADYLKVKSFKRKYPDLTRRVMDAYERSWLQQEGLVPAGRAELGLTALRTDEVMSLLQTDYPEVHIALSDLFRRRRFQKTAEQQKRQYEAARVERGGARAEAARRRALDSAADFNHRLVKERLTNRRCYWDLQTMQIHFPQRSYKLLDPLPYPQGAYPVAVIPGQFVDRYEVYTPDRLMRLPLNRCLYSVPSRKHRDPPPLPTNLRFGSVQPRSALPATVASDVPTNATVDSGFANGTASGTPLDADAGVLNKEDHPNSSVATAQCMICRQNAGQVVRCAECGHTGHPKCLDISDVMLPGVLSYPWSCMECKRCVECADPGYEDQLMFCDKCDRGYHAFCVGLESIPEGQWECPMCTGKPVTRLEPRPLVNKTSPERKTPKRPRKSKKFKDEEDEDSSDDDDGEEDEEEYKPTARRKKKKSVTATDLESGVKRKRGRPPRSSLEPPPPKRKYKPRAPKTPKATAADVSTQPPEQPDVGTKPSESERPLDAAGEEKPVQPHSPKVSSPQSISSLSDLEA